MKIMLKKLYLKRIVAFLSAFFVLCAMPFGLAEGTGEPKVNILVKCGNVTLGGTAEENAPVVVTVTNGGDNSKDAFVFVDDVKADKTGAFEFPMFAMPDVENSGVKCGGEYVVRLNVKGSVVTESFTYFGFDKRAELINKINSARDESELATLLCGSADILNEFGFVTDSIKADNITLFKDIKNKIPFSTDEQKFCDEMSEILIINAVNNLKDDEFGEFLKENDGREINLLFDGVKISDNKEMYAEVSKYVANKKPFKSVSELNNELCRGAVLYLINNASKLTLSDTVKKYNEYIGIASTYLNNYTSSELASREISGRILDKKGNGKFESLSAFNKVLCEMTDEYLKSQNGSSTGGSGSGGSGGSSGGIGGGATQYPIQNNEDSKSPENRYEQNISEIFKDIDGVEWAKDAIDILYKKGIISGRESGSFAPDSPITREEFIKILLGVLEIKPVWNMTVFKDVDADAWYYDWVSTAEKFGITNGISDGLFGTGNNITREEAAATLMRGCSAAGIPIESGTDDKTTFKDFNEISEWAKAAVSDLSRAGVINGRDNGSFEPKDTITRAESAKLLYGILKLRSTGGSI